MISGIRSRGVFVFLLLLPSTLLFLTFEALPMGWVIRYSVFKTNFIVTRFVGIGNYIKIFQDEKFIRTLVNSLCYTGLMVCGYTIIPLLIALVTSNISYRIRNIVRFVVYVPALSSGVIIANVWLWIYRPLEDGLLNWMISPLVSEPIAWMGIRWAAISGISLMLVMTNMGSITLILMAAVLSVQKDIVDSATVDGASTWQIRFKIIMPMILPSFLFCVLLAMTGSMLMYETIFIMYPTAEAHNLMYDIFDTGFVNGWYGMASAKTVVLVIIIFTLSLIRQKIANQGEEK